jgi:hypothetical protein
VTEDEHFLSELNQGLFFLTAPSRDGLRDALVQPAEMAGYRFETPEMVENMLQHLESTQGALPLLQFAASKLWEERDEGRKLLTEERYQAMGGIAGALASHADNTLAELPLQARPLARAVFLRLVTPERTRAIVSMEELRELSKDTHEIQLLIDILVQARLLVVQTGGGSSGAMVELVHESLVHSWPTLRRWLDEGQEDSVFLEQLRNAARQWNANGRDDDLLWRGEVVEEAQRFQRRYRGELPEVQRAFLDAVFAQAARSIRRKRVLAVGSFAFLGLLVAASAVALVVIRNAQREAERQAVVAQRMEAEARSAEAIARNAEEEAKQRLVEVQSKERQRQEALAKEEKARAELAAAYERQKRTNDELKIALRRAQQATQLAKQAQRLAHMNAQAARQAEAKALAAAEELKKKLQEEQERIQFLEGQLGSFITNLR